VEQDLMALVPKKEWTLFAHLLIYHGRAICIARRPRCAECSLNDYCPGRKEERLPAARRRSKR
jgi:endonuclease-3